MGIKYQEKNITRIYNLYEWKYGHGTRDLDKCLEDPQKNLSFLPLSGADLLIWLIFGKNMLYFCQKMAEKILSKFCQK